MLPRLTIGIPTQGKRPDRLAKAISSALGQSIPAQVLVCDQAKDDSVETIVAAFEHPHVRLHKSPATCLWENWSWCVDQCQSELFAWLQDDDIISPHFARRIYNAFNTRPDAVLWMARLGISVSEGVANWWQATGPLVPMDLLTGGISTINRELVTAGAIFTSHALSPGVAFRVNRATVEAVHNCPKNADLFVERIILAELARHGAVVCDPAVVGMWVMHEGNESREQNKKSGEVARQYGVLANHIDALLEDLPRWRDALQGWALLVGGDLCTRWIEDMKEFRNASPKIEEAVQILERVYPINRPEALPDVASETPSEIRHAVNGKANAARKAVKQR